jgi:hypothetical protein
MFRVLCQVAIVGLCISSLAGCNRTTNSYRCCPPGGSVAPATIPATAVPANYGAASAPCCGGH